MAVVKIRRERCKGCRYCVESCPHGVLDMSEEMNQRGVRFAVVVEEEQCTGCTLCGVMCPDAAIEVYK